MSYAQGAGHGGMVGEAHDLLGMPVSWLRGVGSRGKHPQWLVSRLPDGVCEAVSKIHALLMHSEP